MYKILLGINHKNTEDSIKNALKDHYLCVGTATYKEAIMPLLKSNNVDVLIIRDTLSGSIDILKLVEDIRIESPNTRIVFISKLRDKNDIFLSTLVSYGIYDIINKDVVPLQEIISHVLSPRTFRDVSMYYNGVNKADIQDGCQKPTDDSDKPQSGVFFGLFGSKNKKHGHEKSQFKSVENNDVQIDVDTMRSVIREEEMRKIQVSIDDLIDEAVKKAVEDANRQITEQNSEISSLKEDVKRKSSQLNESIVKENEAKIKAEELEVDLKKEQERLQKILEEHNNQIKSLSKVEDPAWFKNQLLDKDSQLKALQEKLNIVSMELENANNKISTEQVLFKTDDALQKKLDNTLKELDNANRLVEKLESELKNTHSVDLSDSNSDLNYAEDLSIECNEHYIVAPNGSSNTIVFMGAKHGVGNTTVAINTAVILAQRKYKVLYMEFNRNFPMINHFFEFLNVTNGIDTACDGIISNNTTAVDKAIIKPKLIKAKNGHLNKAYKRLPENLHFMLFTNDFLIDDKKNIVNDRSIKDLFYYLTMKLQYSYIVVDIQPDDKVSKELFLNSGFMTDKLVITMSQDTHGVVSTGYILKDLASGRSVNLVKNAFVVLNKFQKQAVIKKNDIQKWLGVGNNNFAIITDDSVSYLDSFNYSIPYACTRAKFVSDYLQIIDYIIS